jgi:Spy/CpxP family protein refolding chaperone
VRIDLREEVTAMLGFIIGTVCLIGLIKVLRRGRGWYGHRWGYGPHGGGYDHGYGHMGGGGSRWFLRGLFHRLETTPGQEKAIVAAIDELRENRRVVHEELQQTRGDVARVVAGGLVEDNSLEETFARQDRLLAQLRVSFVEAMKKITEVLDERQRKQIADMVAGGFFRRWGGGGPYRGGVWA